MFTGIIRHLGTIVAIEPVKTGIQLMVNGGVAWPKASIGESVSINGVCSTITSQKDTQFTVVYMPETLEKTSAGTWVPGQMVNLELPATPTSMLGGHIVTGHIDVTGFIAEFQTEPPFARLAISFPSQFGKYLIPKGSVVIDGMSLTVGEVEDGVFAVYLIPHTLEITTLKNGTVGQIVNLEFDPIGKYVEKLLSFKTD